MSRTLDTSSSPVCVCVREASMLHTRHRSQCQWTGQIFNLSSYVARNVETRKKYVYIFRLTLERANYASSRNKLLKCVCEMQIEYEIYDLSAELSTQRTIRFERKKKHILSAIVWLRDVRPVARNCGNRFRAQIFRAGIFLCFCYFFIFGIVKHTRFGRHSSSFFYSSSYFSGVIFIPLVSNLNADSENVIIKWNNNKKIYSFLFGVSETRVWVPWYAQYTVLIYVYFCNADHRHRGEAVELDKIKSHFTAFFMRAPCAERTRTTTTTKNWKWNVEYKAEEQRH